MSKLLARLRQIRAKASEHEELARQMSFVAEALPDGPDRVVAEMSAAAHSAAHSHAERQVARVERAVAEPISELHGTVSRMKLREARQDSAVRTSEGVYLPAKAADTVPLPNIWLRSNLFSASEAANVVLVQHPLFCAINGVRLLYSGHALDRRSRAVLAACIDLHAERALLPTPSLLYVWTSAPQLALAAGIPRGGDQLKQLHEQLIWLSGAQLVMHDERHGRSRVSSVPRLFDFQVRKGVRGSEVGIRISAELALLYGHGEWTAIRQAALLPKSGLRTWLAAYYATHSKPSWLSIPYLAQLSGWLRLPERLSEHSDDSPEVLDWLAARLRAFRFELRAELTELQQLDVPEYVRIVAVVYSDGDGDCVWVCRDKHTYATDARKAAHRAGGPPHLRPTTPPYSGRLLT